MVTLIHGSSLGVELSNEDIADDDDEENDAGAEDAVANELKGALGAELSSIPSHMAASMDSLLTTGTESPVMVSPPLSDDGVRTPKNSQGTVQCWAEIFHCDCRIDISLIDL